MPDHSLSAPVPPSHGRATDDRVRRSWSLQRMLPLYMTVLLTVMLTVTLVVTYAALTRSARSTALERLQRAADQLGSLAETSMARTRGRLAATARDSAVQLALEALNPSASAPEMAAARATLARLLTSSDTGLTAELWNANGRRLAAVGRGSAGDDAVRPQGAETRDTSELPPGLDDLAATDSARVGALYLIRDVPHLWVVAPVIARGARLGYVARQYRIAEGPRADETIRGLAGAEVGSYYRNADGSVWTTITGGRAGAPAARDSTGGSLIATRPGVGELIAVEKAITGTPLVLVLELPLRSVLAEPQATIRWLALASLVILLAGALIAGLVSRRITRPLLALADSARAIAQGDYGARVQPAGAEELARVGESFNHMAAEVGTARDEMEMQMEEAQALAEELELANQDLASSVRQLEESEAQFRALADAIPQLAWMAHADGSIFWYNQRWFAYTGTTLGQMQGWGWQTVHDPATLPEVVARWQTSITTGVPFEMEVPLRGADGQFRWFLTRVEPLRDSTGRVVRWFGTNTDVQALRDTREAAEAASRAKSDFLAVMSHELRTPLNAIGGYTDLIDLGLRGPVSDAQRRDIGRIRASQQHLLGLISSVLDLSRIEARKVSYDLTAVAVHPFLEGLDALVAPQAAAKSLTLDCVAGDPHLAVLADREKLRQILLNLLSNAIRHTPSGGRIVLAAAATDEGTVAISVRDTGPGIAPEVHERVFEPFVQLGRSLTQVREGIGLGLAISRDLARGMGGEISVESELGAGACFRVTLPRTLAQDGGRTMLASGDFPAVRNSASTTPA